MTDDVEVVARALHEKNRLRLSAFCIAQGKDPKTVDLQELKHWEDLAEDAREVCRDNARAAMSADPRVKGLEEALESYPEKPPEGLNFENLREYLDRFRAWDEIRRTALSRSRGGE